MGLKIKAAGLPVGYAPEQALVFHVGDPYKTDPNGKRDPAVLARNTRLIEEKWGASVVALKRKAAM